MMVMIILSILLVVSFTGIAIWIRRELPDSMSALVYLLDGRWQWLWIAWLWVSSALVCIPLTSALPETLEFFGFLAFACLLLCGAMPLADRTTSKRMHDVFGIAGGVLSQTCVAILGPWLLVGWLLWPFLMGSAVVQQEGCCMRRLFSGKGVFVAEAICFLTVACSLLECYI